MKRDCRLVGFIKKCCKSLTGRLWVVMISIVLFFLIAFLISFVYLGVESKRDYEIREAETVVNSVSTGIMASIDSYKDISRLIMINESVVKFLRCISPDAGMINDTRIGIRDVLNVSTNVDSVFIFRNDGQCADTGKGVYFVDYALMKQDEWKDDIAKKRGGAVIGINGNGAIHKNNGKEIITISRTIYDINSQKPTGTLLMNISIDMVKKIVEAQPTGRVCVLTDEGVFLCGDESLMEYADSLSFESCIENKEIRKGAKRRMISGYRIPEASLLIICDTTTDISMVPSGTMYAFIALMVAFLFSIFLAGLFVTRNITQPIWTLTKAMEKTQESGWMESIDVAMPRNEIGMLANRYNSMIAYLNDLFTKLIDKEKSVQKAEMRVLHEQIKPHFLYNSLETISFLALDAGADDVHEALETLGSFYRNFLSKGDREIPLRREISIIKDYLSLQKLRYKDVIEDEYHIAEETLECMIPKLILQPLVENSIYHGIRLTGEPGRIIIRSFMEEDSLHIVVHDTGVGIPEDQIASLLAVDEGDNELSKQNIVHDKTDSKTLNRGLLSGFGLKGTIERLRYYCDSNDVVQIRSEKGEYTEIELVIPFMQREVEDNNV